MPLVDNTHYVDSVAYTAVTAWAVATAKTVGNMIRATAPTAGNERVFVCIIAGTTHATTQPTWVITRGAKTTDNTVTWQECTGLSAVNGDITNTPTWAEMKAITSTGVLGQILINNAETHVFIMSTAGTIGGSEPSFSTTTGATTVDNGATWTCLGAVGSFTGPLAPHARVSGALTTTWAAADNKVYVENSHTESAASWTWVGVGTLAAPVFVLCHNGGAYPPLAANISTGASLTSTGAAPNFAGVFYAEGFNFNVTVNGGIFTVGNVAAGLQHFKNCNFIFSGSAAAACLMWIGGASGGCGHVIFDNVSYTAINASQNVALRTGNFTWKNSTAFPSGTPTSFLTSGAAFGGMVVNLEGLDLSQFGSGKTLVNTSSLPGKINITNCKLNSLVTKFGASGSPAMRITFTNCNAGDVNYDNAVSDFYGTMTTETDVVLLDGASDLTTPIAWKVITSAYAKFTFPFTTPPLTIWNEIVGAPVTCTVQGTWNGLALPTDGEIFAEFEYLGTSGSSLMSFVNDGKATTLTTAAAQSAGAGSWGGGTTQFSLACTFTPREKGPIIARVKVCKASDTFYINPTFTIEEQPVVFAEFPLTEVVSVTPTAGWSMSRPLYSSYASSLYTDAGGGAISLLEDQSGNNRDLSQGVGGKQPIAVTAGPNSRAAADFDGSSDAMTGAALSNFISNSAGYVIVSVMFDAITLSGAQAYQDHGIIADVLGYFGIIASNTGSPDTVRAFNYDGTQDYANEVVAVINTPYVIEWKHESGSLYVRVNGVSWSAATASGNTSNVTGTMQIGVGYTGTGNLDGKIFEVATFSAIPTTNEQDELCANFMNWIGAT